MVCFFFFFLSKFSALTWQTNSNEVFPSLEGPHPLEEGCSQAALQAPTASEGPWCLSVGCAPEEDAAGGSPAETCLGSASCQLPQGEDGPGTVEIVPWIFYCLKCFSEVREDRNCIWVGRRKEYLCEIQWCGSWYWHSACGLFCGFSFSGMKLWHKGARSKLHSLHHILIPSVHQRVFLD